MRSLLSRLWADDAAAVVAPEILLILALTVIGIIPCLVALRNAQISSLATMGNALLALQTGFSFAPFTITDSSGNTIATFDGAEFSGGNATYFTSAEGNSVSISGEVVDPAP